MTPRAPAAETGTADTPVGRVYGGVAPDARRRDRRRRLLDTAYDLFATEGYVNVPIQRLCSTAGVTARHLYEVFPSREEVLVALHTALIDECAHLVVEAVAGVPADDPYAMSEVGIDTFLHFMLDDPRRARIICFEVMSLPPEHLEGCMRRYIGILEAYASTLAADGLLGTERPHLSSVLLAGGIRELMSDWLRSPHPESIETLVAEALRAFVLIGGFAPKDRSAPT